MSPRECRSLKEIYEVCDNRQGVPKTSFSKIDDLHSLGVVLLEVGLWRTARAMHEKAASQLDPGSRLDKYPLQEYFIKMAQRRLAHHMGSAYLDIVLACLDCTFENRTSATNR